MNTTHRPLARALCSALIGLLFAPTALAQAPDSPPAAAPTAAAPAAAAPVAAAEGGAAPAADQAPPAKGQDNPSKEPPPVVKIGPTDGRVLPPSTNKLLEAAFAKMGPTLVLENAEIAKVKVQAKVCDAAKTCYDLTLSDPSSACAGETVGQWCVTWQTAPPAEAKQIAHDALAADPEVWAIAKHKPLEGHTPGTVKDMPAPGESTPVADANAPPHEPPPLDEQAEMSDPSLLLLIAAGFGVLIAGIALFRMRGDDEEDPEKPDSSDKPAE